MSVKKTFSVLVLTRNHEMFIEECLTSLDQGLKQDVKILVVNIGSTDNTAEIVSDFKSSFGRAIDQLAVTAAPYSSTHGLQLAANNLSSDFVAIISGDDAVTRDYGEVATLAIDHFDNQCVFNFVLSVTDQYLSHNSFSKPRWTRNSMVNSLLLYFENPGKSPGSLLPVEVLRNSKFMSIDARCLIEDYPLWLALNGRVQFRKIGDGEVLYRRHPHALSGASSSAEFAWSIGYCLGLAEGSTRSILKRVLLKLGRSRWMNQVDPSMHHVVLDGVATGIKFDWSLSATNI